MRFLLVPALLAWAFAGGGGGCGTFFGAPQLVGFIPTPGTARDVVTDPARKLAYVASDEFGLTVVDVSKPSAPVALGAPIPPFVGTSLAVSGSLAAVTSADGVRFVDVGDPLLPKTTGILAGVVGSGIALAGQYAYVRVVVPGNPAHTDLVVVNVANPADPRVVSQVYVAGGDRVEVAGSYAYLTTGSALAIYDVGNPASPQLRGSLAIPSGARELAVSGNTAFVGNLSAVYAVDVTNRSSPRIVGSVATPATDLAVAGGKLYVLNGTQFRVVDVANPAAPFVQGSVSGFPNSFEIEVVGSSVVLASPAAKKLLTFDVADPAAPRLVQEQRVPGFSYSIAKTSGYVAVGDSTATLDLFQLLGP